jgi:osmotically-inducible protein OsmY
MMNRGLSPMFTRPDAEVERDARDALYSDVRIDGRDVEVIVQNGIVYLKGAVPDVMQKSLAREVIARLKGVRDVVNELVVTPVEGRNDADITADVAAALTRDSLVDEKKIEVETHRGVVYLRGVVGSYTERRAADSDVRSTPGVLDVIDELTVAVVLARTDEAISADVKLALETNIAGDLSDVHIDVRDGVVYLTGNASSVEQRWLIDEALRWTPGVVDVVNDLGVVTLQGP